jgi:hypothetical protein
MIHRSLQFAAAVFAGVLAISTGTTWAAKAPMSPKDRAKQATNIVTGKVLEVTSKVQKSEVEKAIGIHRDRVFTITIQVKEVSKGDGIAVGQKIAVVAWQPETRKPPLPGLQGHDAIPKKGELATFYLKSGKGKVYEPLLPNGIEIK